MDHATPTSLISVWQQGPSLTGHKLRIAGRVLCYDSDTNLVLLVDGDTGVLVDTSLCPDLSGKWCKERLTVVFAVGQIEASTEPLIIQNVPKYLSIPVYDKTIVLRALFVMPAKDLDLVEWNKLVDQILPKNEQG